MESVEKIWKQNMIFFRVRRVPRARHTAKVHACRVSPWTHDK